MNIQKAVKTALAATGSVAFLFLGLGGWYYTLQDPYSDACSSRYAGFDSDHVGHLGPASIITLAEKGYRLTGCGTGTLTFSDYPLHTPNCYISYDSINHELLLMDNDSTKRIAYKLYGDGVDAIPSVPELKELSSGFSHC